MKKFKIMNKFKVNLLDMYISPHMLGENGLCSNNGKRSFLPEHLLLTIENLKISNIIKNLNDHAIDNSLFSLFLLINFR